MPILGLQRRTIYQINGNLMRIWLNSPNFIYSQLSNKSTGTMEKNLPKSLAVLTFSCGTIGMNSRFLLVVLLFQRYYRVNFGRFKLEINRNEHYLLWKWYIKVSLIHINLMCMVEDWLHWSWSAKVSEYQNSRVLQ